MNTYIKKNGAKEGLEKKLTYWKEKDYQYEFGVTMGASINNLLAIQPTILGDGIDSFINELGKVFEASLRAKSDQRLIALFDAYYANKKKGLEGDTAVEIT